MQYKKRKLFLDFQIFFFFFFLFLYYDQKQNAHIMLNE